MRAPRVELSIEHMALGWAWHDAKNAAALACVLLRWATPAVQWVTPDDPAVAVWNEQHDAEQPAGDPYRTAGVQRVNVDPIEVTEARYYVANVASYIGAFVEGRVPDPPKDFGEPNEHVMTRLYWYAAHLGEQTVKACEAAGEALKTAYRQQSTKSPEWARVAADVGATIQHWIGLGAAAKAATEFIRKFATSNPVIGAADGAASGTLKRIGELIAYAGKPTTKIIEHMFFWRIRDGLKGKELPPNMETTLHAAFEAAWSAGEYEFAYGLFDDLDTLAVP